MSDLFNNLFSILSDNFYLPLKESLLDNELFNNFIDLINKIIFGLFGNNMSITSDNVASGLAIVVLIILLTFIINIFITTFNLIFNGFTEIGFRNKKRR